MRKKQRTNLLQAKTPRQREEHSLISELLEKKTVIHSFGHRIDEIREIIDPLRCFIAYENTCVFVELSVWTFVRLLFLCEFQTIKSVIPKSKLNGNSLNTVKADSCRCARQVATRVYRHQLKHCLFRNYYKYCSHTIDLSPLCLLSLASLMRLSSLTSGVNASNTNQQSKIITESNHHVTSHESVIFKVVFVDFTWPSLFHELTFC